MRKFLIVAISLLFFSSLFGMVAYIPGTSVAAAPPSTISNDLYLNGTLSGQTGSTTTLSQQTLTLTAPMSGSSQSISLDTPTSTSWTSANGNSLATNNYGTIGTYNYYSGSYVQLYGYEFYMGLDSIAYATIGTVYANLTMGSSTYSFSHTFNANPSTDTVAEISAQWHPSLASGSYSVALQIQVTDDPGDPWVQGAPYGGQTSSYGNFPTPPGGELTTTYEAQGTYPGFMTGWDWTGTINSNSYSYTLPADTVSYTITWTAQDTSYLIINGNEEQTGTGSSYTVNSSSQYSIYLRWDSSSTPSGPSYTGTVDVTASTETPESQAYNSGALSQDIMGSINYWNQTNKISFTIPLPSGWNSGASFSGSINHILSAGYGTGALSDQLTVTSLSSTTFNPPTGTYLSYSISGTIGSSGLTISISTSEFITYSIATTATPPDFSSIDQSPATFALTYSSPIKLSEIQAFVGGTLEDRYTNVSYSGSASFSYLDPSLSPLYVQWELSTGEYTQWVNFSYGGSTGVPENSSSVIVMQSSTATHSYPITLSGVPYGVSYPISITTDSPNSSLTYQQELQLNTSGLGMDNSLGNQLFIFSNGTNAYAWIQSYNSTSQIETVWVKMYSDINQTLNWNIYPSSFNWLNATGYLGYNRAYFNAPLVFNYATDFTNLTGWSVIINDTTGNLYSTGSMGLHMKTASSSSSHLAIASSATFNLLAEALYVSAQMTDTISFSNGVGVEYSPSNQYNQLGIQASEVNPAYWSAAYTQSSFSPVYLSSPYSSAYTVMSMYFAGSNVYFGINGTYENFTPSAIGGTAPITLYDSGNQSNLNVSYMFISKLTPADMPSASVGSGSNFQPSGYYQQEITVTGANATKDGLNSQDSNFLITSSNGTTLYTWIQQTGTNLTFWIKTPYSASGSETLSMEVFPQFENLLSVNGYLGYSATDFNAKLLDFPYATDFSGASLPSGWSQNGTITVKDGLYVNGSATNKVYYNDMGSSSSFFAGLTILNYTGSGGNAFEAWGSAAFVARNQTVIQAAYYNGAFDYLGSPYGISSAFTVYGMANLSSGVNVYVNGSYDSLLPVVPTEGPTFTGLNPSASSFFVKYFIVPSISLASMPTTSISGSGSDFMANATTSGSFQGVPSSYNSTWVNAVYNIPLQPNTNYATVFINQSWIISNLFPSTYKIFPGSGMILFSDLSGFQSIEVATIQPSIATTQGTSTPVFLSLTQQGTGYNIPNQYYSYFSPRVTYTDFGSDTVQTLSPGTMDFSLPFGASVSVQILDYWQQQVGFSSFQVTNQSQDVTIPLNVSEVYFTDNNTGALASQVSIRSGGYNLTGGNPQYIQNGSSYEWFTSALDPQTYQLQLYSGIVKGNNSIQYVTVPIGAPISTLIVEARAFNGSGIRQLGNAGSSTGLPTADLYIDGVSTFFGDSFEGTLGQTYNITIYDVLGHLLFQENLTLNSPLMSETFQISTPSYILGFVNDEAVNGSSPYATQYSSIKVANSTGPYYNFTTHVNLESEVYLAANQTYFLSTHDNLTATKYISLTNSSRYFAFNGSNIKPITQAAFNYSALQLSLNVYIPPTEANYTSNGTITLSLVTSSGIQKLNQSETESVLKNTTLEVTLNNKAYGNISAYYISPGLIGYHLNISKTGTSFALNVSISSTAVEGKPLSYNASYGFSVVGYNPLNPNSGVFSQWWTGLASSFIKNIFWDVLGAIVIFALAYIYHKLKEFLTHKRNQREFQDNMSLHDAIVYMGAVSYSNIDALISRYNEMNPVLRAAWDSADKDILKDPDNNVMAFHGKKGKIVATSQAELRDAIKKYRATHGPKGEKESMIKRFEQDLEGDPQ